MSDNRVLSQIRMNPRMTNALKLSASLSYRVATRRHSLTLPISRSTMLRRLYVCLSSRLARSRYEPSRRLRLGINGSEPRERIATLANDFTFSTQMVHGASGLSTMWMCWASRTSLRRGGTPSRLARIPFTMGPAMLVSGSRTGSKTWHRMCPMLWRM